MKLMSQPELNIVHSLSIFKQYLHGQMCFIISRKDVNEEIIRHSYKRRERIYVLPQNFVWGGIQVDIERVESEDDHHADYVQSKMSSGALE